MSPWLVLLGFVAIAAFFLLTEHRAHVFGVVPYLRLLACPLLHFFLHRGRGHGGHQGHGSRPGDADDRGERSGPHAPAGRPRV